MLSPLHYLTLPNRAIPVLALPNRASPHHTPDLTMPIQTSLRLALIRLTKPNCAFPPSSPSFNYSVSFISKHLSKVTHFIK